MIDLDTQTTDEANGLGAGEGCAVATAAAELQPLVLAVAFDVSGRMGKGDEPYHDRALKWDPVVAATRAFFESDDLLASPPR